MEPNGFVRLTLPRASGFPCSQVEFPLPTQEETLLDRTAPVRALPSYLRNHSQGRRSHSASTPSASILLARGSLLCIRTRLQKRVELAVGPVPCRSQPFCLRENRIPLASGLFPYPPRVVHSAA
jgi:hypothetical protein